MEMGAGVGRRRSGENCLGGLPTSLYRPTNLAVSPAGRRAIPAMRQTSIQNTSSVGPPKRSGRPPGGPALGLVSPGRLPKNLQDLGKRHGNSSQRDVTCINEKNMVCRRNQQPTNVFARKST
jgi:hypothetical protein